MTRKTGSADNGRRFQSQSETDHLVRRIEAGVLQNGNQLASELDLAREFGVARGTMGNALNNLSTRYMETTKHVVSSFSSSVRHGLSKTQEWTRAKAETPEELRWPHYVETDTYHDVRHHVNANKPMSKDISYIPSSHTRNLLMERELLDDPISLTLEATETLPISSVQDVQTTQPPTTYCSHKKVNAFWKWNGPTSTSMGSR